MDFLKLIDRVCNNEQVDKAELDELFRWLSSQEGRELFERNVTQQWSACDGDKQFDYSDMLREIHLIQQRRETVGSRRAIRKWRRIAAVVFLPLALAAAFLFTIGPDRDSSGHVAITKAHNDVILNLPDGSEIVLDRTVGDCCVTEHEGAAFSMESGKLVQEKRGEVSAADADLKWGTVEVPRGSQFDMVLEDGTHVWLNADSRLRFPLTFPQGERRVYVEGEAYFEVSENPQKPFFVETPSQNLRVLGTKFNVYAYPEEENIYTSLVAGSVMLTSKMGQGGMVLRPGQQACLSRKGGDYVVSDVDAAEAASWRNAEFVFDNISLEKVFAKLKRWYDFEYEFEDPSVASRTMYGSIPIYDDIWSVLELIESSGIAVAKQEGGKVIVSVNK